jgi:hypothetical protein
MSMRSPPSTRRCRRPYRILLLERLESRVVPGFLAPLAFDAGSFPRSVAIGDFDGDGHLDLAVANYGSANVSVLLGNGDGSFQTARNFPTGSGPRSVARHRFGLPQPIPIQSAVEPAHSKRCRLPAAEVSALLNASDSER